MRLRALALLILVPLSHELYHAFSGWDANWCQWVAEHGAGVVLCLILGEQVHLHFQGHPRFVALVALGWMGAEDLQAEICGSLRWGAILPGPGRLCRDEYGTHPYVIICVGALAFAIARGILTWKKVA